MFVVARDVSADKPTYSSPATRGHQRWTFTSVVPTAGTPTVSLRHGDAGISVVSSTATSVTVDVVPNVSGSFELVAKNERGSLAQASRAEGVEVVELALPGVHTTQSVRKFHQGEEALHVLLCPDECRYGNPRLVDSALVVTGLERTAWDTITLPPAPGLYPITLESAAVADVSTTIEVVSVADDIGMEAFDGASQLAQDDTLCFFGLHAGERVLSRAWTVTETSGLLALNPSTRFANCFSYEGASAETYVLTVEGAGLTRELAFTVAATE